MNGPASRIGRERFPAIPLAIWVGRALERIGLEHDAPALVLASHMEISERLLLCWRDQVDAQGARPVFSWRRSTVEDALHLAGVAVWEVLPWETGDELGQHGYCRRCGEDVPASARGRCLWCDAPIARESYAAEIRTRCPDCGGRKSRGGVRCRACADKLPRRKHDPAETVCPGCGGPKERRSRRCARCWAADGKHTGDRLASNKLTAITEQLLEEARELYATRTMAEVVEEIYERTGYASRVTCEKALFSAFRSRGWETRRRGSRPPVAA